MAIIERKPSSRDAHYLVSYNKQNLKDSEFICDTAEEAAYMANKLTYDFFFDRIVLNGIRVGDETITFNLNGDSVNWIEDYFTFFTKEMIEDIAMDEDGGGNELIYIKKINF